MNHQWYKIDNAGKIFPAIMNKNRSNYFRMAVQLTEEVDPIILTAATAQTIRRYPAFAVHLRRGLFWYYLDHYDGPAPVYPETNTFGSFEHPLKQKQYLFRVLYHNRRIALEIFHSLTDGTGAIEMLKTIILQYLRLKGHPVEAEGVVLDAYDQVLPDESKDSFNELFDAKNRQWIFGKPAFHLKGTKHEWHGQAIVHAYFSVQALLAYTQAHKITITALFAGILLYQAYLERQKNKFDKHPIIIDIPVNLRKFYPSTSVRNFVLFVNVGGDIPDAFTLEDSIQLVSKQLKDGLTTESLTPRINAHVSGERNPFVRIAPLFLKNIILKQSYELFGERVMTTALSNLGKVEVSSSMKPYIEHFEFILSASHVNVIATSACTYNDQLVWSFTRSIREPTYIRNVLQTLTELTGVSPIVSSNRWGEWQP